MISEYLTELFIQLNKKIPPPENCHHAMILTNDAGDEQLAIILNVQGVFSNYYLDDEDFDMSAELMADVIISLWKENFEE